MILLALPEFCVDEAEEEVVMGDADEAGGGKRGLWIRQAVRAEAGEDAEGEVEGSDIDGREGLEDCGARWAEVGEKPKCAGADGGEAGGDLVDFGLGEAVEEEVGDDEVGIGCGADS